MFTKNIQELRVPIVVDPDLEVQICGYITAIVICIVESFFCLYY